MFSKILKKSVSILAIAVMLLTSLVPGISGNVLSAADTILQESSSSRPASFDLRNVDGKNYVTSVKSQGVYGTCWSFAAVSALETSILYQLGITNEQYIAENGHELDLSERALAYYGRTFLTGESGKNSVFGSQAGEGDSFLYGNSSNAFFSLGGVATTATSILSSGSGILYESQYPYRGNQGIIRYAYKNAAGEKYKVANSAGKMVIYTDTTGDYSGLDASVKENYPICYKAFYDIATDDWSLTESDRYKTIASLAQTNMLPSTALLDTDSQGNLVYSGFSQDACDAIKDELLQGRAVTVYYYSDTSTSGESSANHYINGNTFAHYTYKALLANHVVTIVGYDDNYSASNFLDHSSDADGDGTSHLPEGNGAWIVKNSWGCTTEEFPNYGEWGVDGSGYFYLSYYDRSLVSFESFTLDISQLTSGQEQYIADEYDCMTANGYTSFYSTNGDTFADANVFCAGENQILDHVGVTSANAGSQVEVQIYVLNKNYTSPVDGTVVATLKDTFTYSGYHTINLDKLVYLPKGTYYSVVVLEKAMKNGTMTTVCSVAYGRTQAWMQYQSQKNNNANLVYETAVVNPGESYVYRNGTWVDWASADAEALKKQLSSTVTTTSGEIIYQNCYDNFPIKAFSQKTEGTVENLSYSLSADGILAVTGSGDISQALEKGEYVMAPWLGMMSLTKKMVVASGITGIVGTDGTLSKTMLLFNGWLQIGTGKDAKLYYVRDSGDTVVRDDTFQIEETGVWYHADEKGIVTEVTANVASDIGKINSIGKVTLDNETKSRIDDARAAYNSLTEEEKEMLDDELLKELTDAEEEYAELLKATEYTLIDGKGAAFTKGTDANLTFRGSGDYSKFKSVAVDGAVLDEKNYTAVPGSTVITLNNAYLSTLSEGNHTIEIIWTDGTVSTDFIVAAAAPKTNGNANLVLWIAVAVTVIVVIAVILIVVLRKKKNTESHS